MPYAKDHKARTRARILRSAQRLFSSHGFHGTTIEVRGLPAPAAAAAALWLASRTQRPALTPAQQTAMAAARPLRFGTKRRLVAFEWGPGAGAPLVVLVHGRNGRAAQLAPMIGSFIAPSADPASQPDFRADTPA